jgi:hypothetical protein
MLRFSSRRALLGVVALAALIVGVVLVLSSSESEAPAFVNQPLPTARPTEPPTPEPTATPKPLIPIPQAFRDFVRLEVEPALAAEDLGFFAQRAITEHVVCIERYVISRQPGEPLCRFVGEEFDAVPVGRYGSEGWRLRIDDALAYISSLFTLTVSGESDAYGGAEPRIFALGASDVYVNNPPELTDQDEYTVIITAIVERPPQETPRGPGRVALWLDWREVDGEYRLHTIVDVKVLLHEVLDEPGPSWWWGWERY